MLGICNLSVLVLHETLLVPVLTYGNEAMLWKEDPDLELGLYRWTTSETCLVLGRWIESQIQDKGVV